MEYLVLAQRMSVSTMQILIGRVSRSDRVAKPERLPEYLTGRNMIDQSLVKTEGPASLGV